MKAIMFPGQGAQYAGMGKDLYDHYSQAKEIFSSIDEVLGDSVSEKCFGGQIQELKDTATQQLAILAVSLAAYEVFQSRNSLAGVTYLSGLSLGEYSCLYAGGVLSLENVTLLIRERALSMQKAAQMIPSTMLAIIGMTKEELTVHAEKDGFYIANINSPKQIVISVRKDDCQKVKEALAEEAMKVVELEVSGGFHCPFMEPAKQHLAKVIDSMPFTKARIPIMSNYTARPHSDPQEIRNNLLQQLVCPVLWSECIEYMVACGVSCFYEVGPSRVLKGLMRKINLQAQVINIEKVEDLEKIQEVKT